MRFIVCGIGLLCAGWLFGQEPSILSSSSAPFPEHAKEQLEAARNGNGMAMMRANRAGEVWGTKPPFKAGELQKRLSSLAMEGNPEAMWALGWSLQRSAVPGSEYQATLAKGEAWIRKAADSGYGPAMLDMELFLPNETREEKNGWIQRGFAALLDEAKAGKTDAMLQLMRVPPLIGDDKTEGKTLITLVEKIAWLRKAKELGSIEAMIKLCEWLLSGGETGQGTLETHQAAQQEGWEMAMKLVEMGHWPTSANIGVAYADGAWPRSTHPEWDWDPEGGKEFLDSSAKAWEWWDRAIDIAGKKTVLLYLRETHELGEIEPTNSIQPRAPLPPRPKKP